MIDEQSEHERDAKEQDMIADVIRTPRNPILRGRSVMPMSYYIERATQNILMHGFALMIGRKRFAKAMLRQ